MSRVSIVRLSAKGAMALEQRYRSSRKKSIVAFCEEAGVARSAYYALRERKVWFEAATIQARLEALKVPGPWDADYFEYKGEYPETLSKPLCNIPLQLTRFVGREREILRVKALLMQYRLLTLLGTGGCGKTRLMLQVATKLMDHYQDGILLIELASVRDANQIAPTIASQLGLKEKPDQPIVQTFLDNLQAKHLLLILDNCEHLVDACAILLETLLTTCPYLTVLTTSREILPVSGHVYKVSPLSLPALEPITLESLLASEAGQLFVDRVRMMDTEFCITESHAGTIAQICRRLDGIPLAIELAAARVRMMSLEELNQGLNDRFRLLTGGKRTAQPRQQTLRSLIDWSYNLISERERQLFCRLSIFLGGWTQEAAKAVGVTPDTRAEDVSHLLDNLIDKSLVIRESIEKTSRYRMLETIREYAIEKRLELAEEADLQANCSQYFLHLVDSIKSMRHTSQHSDWYKILFPEKSNLDATLDWCVTEPYRIEQGVGLISALHPFWAALGLFSDYRKLCERIIVQAEHSPKIQWAHLALGQLAYLQSDYPDARQWWMRSLEAAERNSDLVCQVDLLCGLGIIENHQGHNTQAQHLFEQAMELLPETGQDWIRSELLHHLGIVAYERGDYSLAEDYYRQSLEWKRKVGDQHSIAFLLHDLGNMAKDRGEYTAAQYMHEEALHIFEETHAEAGKAISLNDLGLLAVYQGNLKQAQFYLEQSLAIHRRHDTPAGRATVQCNLSIICLRERRFPEAQALLREALAQLANIEEVGGTCRALGWLACVKAARGQMRSCLHLLSRQKWLHHTHRIVPLAAELREQMTWTASARNAVFKEEYDHIMQMGGDISIDDWLTEAT